MLKTRVMTAVVMLGVLLGALFGLSALAFAAFALVVASVAAWEFARLVGRDAASQKRFAAMIALACIAVGWFVPGTTGVGAPAAGEATLLLGIFGVATLFWVLVCPLWLRQRWSLGRKNPTVGGVLALVVLVPTWLAMLALRQQGVWTLLGAMAVAWVADIAAYFVGRAFGKRKLAPEISPGKTVAGAYGAIVGVAVYCAIIAQVSGRSLGADVFAVAFLAVLLTAVSIWGDLLESLLKRQVGVKDSSQLLPGHGGVMDRIDSLTAVLPVTALALMML